MYCLVLCKTQSRLLSYQSGLSLLELLLAMTLGMVVIIGFMSFLIQVQVKVNALQSLIQEINRIRFINFYLSKQLGGQHAYSCHQGHMVCLGKPPNIKYFLAKSHGVLAHGLSLYVKHSGHRRVELANHMKNLLVQPDQNGLKIWLRTQQSYWPLVIQ